jgi:hypothetical protein
VERISFQQALAPLYPELVSPPDPDDFVESVVVRVLNEGSVALCEQMLGYYGMNKVQGVVQERVNRLDAPVYRQWKARLQLPERSAVVENIHRLWRR